MSTSEDALVSIATYLTLAEADLARMHLAEEGITAVVADSGIVGTNWFLGNAVGYIKVQVRQSDAEVAWSILKSKPGRPGKKKPSDLDDDATYCLACGRTIEETEPRCPACGWSYQEGADEDT